MNIFPDLVHVACMALCFIRYLVRLKILPFIVIMDVDILSLEIPAFEHDILLCVSECKPHYQWGNNILWTLPEFMGSTDVLL